MRLSRRTTLLSVTDAKVRDIKLESYLSALTVPEAGGGLKAREVTLYAPSLRGLLAGQRPWDAAGAETLTAGWVEGLTGTMRARSRSASRVARAASASRGHAHHAGGAGREGAPRRGGRDGAQAHPGPEGDLEADLVVVGRRGAVPALSGARPDAAPQRRASSAASRPGGSSDG